MPVQGLGVVLSKVPCWRVSLENGSCDLLSLKGDFPGVRFLPQAARPAGSEKKGTCVSSNVHVLLYLGIQKEKQDSNDSSICFQSC